ncbi:MAG: DegT/DnrJ/EryC1/StrS family aminotransferase [Bryobacteraceae bacterium]
MSKKCAIPFLDLVTPHKELREELCDVFATVLSNAGFVGGPMVEGFEGDFARYCGTQHCVGVGSGTDALRFALIAAGIRDGDIVVTVPNTFIATVEAISQAGGRPEFVDVDERTQSMDSQKLREYIEVRCYVDGESGELMNGMSRRRVAAIVPVHLYGQTAHMDPILELADRYRLTVVEDACQAHGAQYFSKREGRWRKAGGMGRAAAFSFYPGKNLGACGEAGAVTTNDEQLAKKIRMLRDHGQAQKYYHEIEGYNGRLDAIQAGILKVKLRHLAKWNEQRREIASRYRERIGAISENIGLPHEPPWSRAVYHLFVVTVDDREQLQRHLMDAGIGTGIHYPVPLHLQKAYSHLGYKIGDFPVSEKAAGEILSLPMYPGLGDDQLTQVVRQLEAFASQKRASGLVLTAGAENR